MMMQETSFGINTVFKDKNGISDNCAADPSIEEWTFKDFDVLNKKAGTVLCSRMIGHAFVLLTIGTLRHM